jgi:hypothetical protein
MPLRVVFSEGRGLRARIERPGARRGRSRLRTGEREAGGPGKTTLGLALCRCYGRAEPAPPGGGQARVGWANGGNPEITREAVFSEGRAPRVRKYGPRGSRGMDSCTFTQHFSRPGADP